MTKSNGCDLREFEDTTYVEEMSGLRIRLAWRKQLETKELRVERLRIAVLGAVAEYEEHRRFHT